MPHSLSLVVNIKESTSMETLCPEVISGFLALKLAVQKSGQLDVNEPLILVPTVG